MPKVIDLVRQGRIEDAWQMCCGYLKFDLDQFMNVQNRLMMGQIDSLYKSPFGRKFMGKVKPDSVDEYRQMIPLTDYSAYMPELSEKMEDLLPEKPVLWVHTSGKTGEYPCKWVPMTESFNQYLGPTLCGIGYIAASNRWADTNPMVEYPNMMYTVAPRPYVSGAMASVLMEQMPCRYYPSISKSEDMAFEDRIKIGFDEALSGGIDFFFGLSLVLASVGEKFSNSEKTNVLPYLRRPKALSRLGRGLLRSKLEGRKLLPKDLWDVRGIITSGLDSAVYREKIKEYWGKYPLDIYSCTEGGVIATQTWDYGDMTFIPHLNFFEFIPENEHMKWRADKTYQPKTLLLDEVKSGECYEIVISNFHNGALMRYRIGDMIRITSLRNSNLGIDIPQMVFERRADDLLDFAAIRLSEKAIWQAIEKTHVEYEDWVAYKAPGEMVLNILLETRNNANVKKSELEAKVYENILATDYEIYASLKEQEDLNNMIKFDVKINFLPEGTFQRYKLMKRTEGLDLAHLKPPHVNPNNKVLKSLVEAAIGENNLNLDLEIAGLAEVINA